MKERKRERSLSGDGDGRLADAQGRVSKLGAAVGGKRVKASGAVIIGCPEGRASGALGGGSARADAVRAAGALEAAGDAADDEAGKAGKAAVDAVEDVGRAGADDAAGGVLAEGDARPGAQPQAARAPRHRGDADGRREVR